MAGLLVSVRGAAEAVVALAGGAALIDVKEPDKGSLGRAAPDVLAGVLAAVAGQRPVSAALGEVLDPAAELPADLSGLAYVKWGLAGCEEPAATDWRERLQQLRAKIESTSDCRMVIVGYVDWRRASSPNPSEVAHFAMRERASVLLLDTWHKDGTTLLDWLSHAAISEMREICRAAGVRLALAGSLGARDIRTLLPVQPDWFAVRGAVCGQGQRRGTIEEDRVRQLADLLSPTTTAD